MIRDPILSILLIIASLMSALFLIKTTDTPDVPDEAKYNHLHYLGIHENLYDRIDDTYGTVVLFLQNWCDKSKKVRHMIDDSFELPVIVVDERHPDAVLVNKFPSVYVFNGHHLEKTSLRKVIKLDEW